MEFEDIKQYAVEILARRSKRKHFVAELIAGLAAVTAVSAGAGYAIESHTNEVARGKVATIEACNQIVPQQNTISADWITCIRQHIPGAEPINGHKFKVGEPVEFVDSYVQAQRAEAAHVEPGRVAGWAVGPILVGAYVLITS